MSLCLNEAMKIFGSFTKTTAKKTPHNYIFLLQCVLSQYPTTPTQDEDAALAFTGFIH